MPRFSRLLSGLAVAASLIMAAPAHAHDDADAIRHLMMATFDKPDAPLTVEPVTVFEDIAVAGWSQGDMGGRALLRRKDANWVLTLCSGDALKDATSLQQFGLSVEEAAAMAKAVVDAEAALPASVVAKFATFDGVVMMDPDGQHPPSGAHDSHKS